MLLMYVTQYAQLLITAIIIINIIIIIIIIFLGLRKDSIFIYLFIIIILYFKPHFVDTHHPFLRAQRGLWVEMVEGGIL